MTDFPNRDMPQSGNSCEAAPTSGEVRHPGTVLRMDYMKPLGLSVQDLARSIGVSRQRLHELIVAKRSMTPDTAVRLSNYFPVPARFWLDMQLDYDLWQADAELSGEKCRQRRAATPGSRSTANAMDDSIDALLETHSEIERKVYECMLDERVTRGGIVSIDHLQALSGFHISKVTASLTMLELSGLVKQGFDGCYRLVRNENCRS